MQLNTDSCQIETRTRLTASATAIGWGSSALWWITVVAGRFCIALALVLAISCLSVDTSPLLVGCCQWGCPRFCNVLLHDRPCFSGAQSFQGLSALVLIMSSNSKDKDLMLSLCQNRQRWRGSGHRISCFAGSPAHPGRPSSAESAELVARCHMGAGIQHLCIITSLPTERTRADGHARPSVAVQ